MSDALAAVQDRTFARATAVPAEDVPADVRTQARGEWAGTRLRVRAERMISCASEGAV